MSRRLLPIFSLFSSVQGVCCALALILWAVLPNTLKADLLYRVEKAIKLTDLNPAANGSIPFSITGLNNAGSFVGFFPSATANKLHAFLWENTGTGFIDLNDLLAADSSMATCINDNGTVAGVFWELGTYVERGFVRYSDGTISTFNGPDLGQGPITAVTAMNATDSIIGTYMSIDGTTRGYIIQALTGGQTIKDLGDLGASGSYSSYLWPTALNSLDQVVGNIFSVALRRNLSGYTKGFFWDNGMSLIDASAFSDNWNAVSLNNSGQVIGWYDISSGSGDTFSVAGSYIWDGSTATDIGDLGGGSGANVFAIRDNGIAYGTSLSTDGSLHLFKTENS